MNRVIVIGSSNTDMVVGAHKIPLPGETIMGSDLEIIPGGKGANQAVAAARAGAEVVFVTKTGTDDFGRQAIEGYNRENIDTSHIFTSPESPSGIALIIVDQNSGQNSIVVAPGANSQLAPDEIISIEKEIERADALLIQLEIPVNTVEKSLQLANKLGIKTILDPAPAQQLSDSLLNLVDIITPNESETLILTGVNPDSKENIEKAARILLEKINDTVIITLGAMGVYYHSKNGMRSYIAASQVQAIDTTAAGDVFNGYLTAQLAGGQDLETAIQWAIAAASRSVCRKGAQTSIPFLHELE